MADLSTLPSTATYNFKELMDVYFETPIEFPQLKAITAAQWALESGWGSSVLAKENNNYGGAKWRAGLEAYGRPVRYRAWDGVDTYVHFNDEKAYIQAYWKRLDTIGAYKGWRDHVQTGEAFIKYIGPTWVAVSPEHGQEYVKNVIRICNTHTRAIFK